MDENRIAVGDDLSVLRLFTVDGQHIAGYISSFVESFYHQKLKFMLKFIICITGQAVA